jgi:hypothetical protein
MFPNCFEVGPSGDEGHIIPGSGQSGAKTPADSAGSENYNSQSLMKLLLEE